MANYIRIRDGYTLTECEFYAYLQTAYFYCCNKGWKWQNSETLIKKTARDWKKYFLTNPPVCGCADPNCPSGREIAYLNIIENVSAVDISGQFIEITLNAATFIDNESVVPPTPEYIIDWGDGSPTEIITIGVPIFHAPAGDGDYIATITWQDAVFQFWYRFNFAVLASYQVNRLTEVTCNLDCALYPNYTVRLADAATISAFDITRHTGTVFSTQVYNVAGTTGLTFTDNGTLTSDLSAPANDQIVASYTLDDGVGNIAILNTATLRTQCIS